MYKNILISVVMSVYNGEKYLVDSVDSILNQTLFDYEVIIVNDGSTDSSLKIIKEYQKKDKRLKLINNERNIGLTKSLNKGIGISKGKYIARQDADDISLKNRLRVQYEFLELHPECVAVGSNARIVDMHNTFLYDSAQPLLWEDIKEVLPKNPFFHSSTMFRKDITKILL